MEDIVSSVLDDTQVDKVMSYRSCFVVVGTGDSNGDGTLW